MKRHSKKERISQDTAVRTVCVDCWECVYKRRRRKGKTYYWYGTKYQVETGKMGVEFPSKNTLY
jgi:hypothetical protein